MKFVSASGSSPDDEGRRFAELIRRRHVPDNEIPAGLTTSILLGRTDELAVAIGALRVYSNGVEFTVSARCRGEIARQGGLFAAMTGGTRPGRHPVDEPLLLGFELSDGRTVTNLSSSWPPDLDDDEGPWLSSGNGGGGDRSSDHQFFLSPLPPGDTLALIAAWPAFGIAESRHELDAAAIRTAAAQVVRLWRVDPVGDDPEPPPPPPAVPPGSWFERN